MPERTVSCNAGLGFTRPTLTTSPLLMIRTLDHHSVPHFVSDESRTDNRRRRTS